MTKDDIIRMAREAGMEQDGDNFFSPSHEEIDVHITDLERFAQLVSAEKDKEIERLKLLCEEMLSELYVYRSSEYLKDVTAAIRAKGTK
jgi:hypothetical protein